jgi:competence protein ComEA
MQFFQSAIRVHRSNPLMLAALCLIVYVTIASGQQKQAALPEGPAKEILQRVCSSCHELETVTSARRTQNDWQQTIEDMVARGAEGSDEDLAAILNYLTRYFGKVNVNAASTRELEKSLDFSASEAQAIVSYRERNGNIKDLDELKKIPGVSADKVQLKRAMIAFRP